MKFLEYLCLTLLILFQIRHNKAFPNGENELINSGDAYEKHVSKSLINS